MHIGKAFATYLHHLNGIFCYMFLFWEAFMYTHLRGNFMLYIHTYLHSFEKQFHVTYSRIYTFIGKAIFMLHIHWKGNFCTTYSHFWKAISCHMFLFWEAFSCHIQHICTFAKHLATYSTYVRFIWKGFSSCYPFYIPMYMVKNTFTPSKHQEIIMM